MIPAVTSEMLETQRYEFAKRYGRPVERFNYFAPNMRTMYSPIDGTQNDLWESRWDDGELWSAFLSRDLEHSSWMKNLFPNKQRIERTR